MTHITKYIDSVALLSLLMYAGLVWINQTARFDPLYSFMVIYFLEWLLLLILFSLIPKNLEAKTIKYRIIFWSLIFQLLSLFCQSLLDDDYYRYLWDGYIFSTTGNPYQSTPADYFSKTLPQDMDNILNLINYPHFATIYGPLCQYLFLLINYFRPQQLYALKILLITANIIATWVISHFTKLRYLLLFAWCPLLIIESVYEVHIEIISIMFILLAVFIAFKLKTNSIKHEILILLCCASALAAKIFAAPFVLLLMLRCRKKIWPLFFIFIFIFYFPFITNTTATDIYSLHLFLSQWQFNSSAFEIFNQWLDHANSRLLCLLLFACVMVCYLFFWQKKIAQSFVPRGDIIFGALLLFSPVVNPWYLLWLLPFFVIYPSLWALTALIVAPLSYINGFYLENSTYRPYQIPLLVQITEYGIILFALFIDTIRHQRVSHET